MLFYEIHYIILCIPEINDINCLIMVYQERNKTVPIRLFYNNTGRAVIEFRIVNLDKRFISRDKTGIKGIFIPGAYILNYVPFHFRAICFPVSHVICSHWNICVYRIRIFRHVFILQFLVKCAQKRRKCHLLKIRQLVWLNSFLFTEIPIYIIRRKLRPVMVGTEIQILVIVFTQGINSIYRLYAVRQTVIIPDGLLLIRSAQRFQLLFAEHDS